MTDGWSMTAAQAARSAQQRRGWSDRALLAQLLVFVRTQGAGLETPPADSVREVLHSVTSDAERVEAVLATPAPLPGQVRDRETLRQRQPVQPQHRRTLADAVPPLLIIAATLTVLVVLAVAWVLLTSWFGGP